jgi:hypothetical protein
MRFRKRETEKEEVFETEINLREIVSPKSDVLVSRGSIGYNNIRSMGKLRSCCQFR